MVAWSCSLDDIGSAKPKAPNNFSFELFDVRYASNAIGARDALFTGMLRPSTRRCSRLLPLASPKRDTEPDAAEYQDRFLCGRLLAPQHLRRDPRTFD
jgi:hypothetical protein